MKKGQNKESLFLPSFFSVRGRAGLLHLEELHVENQRLVRADVATGTAGAVGEFGGDVEAELGAFLHELHAFGPAGDDAIEGELDGFLAAVAAVENGAVDQRAFVVDLDGVGGLRALAGAFGDHLVLEAGGRDGHAFLFGVVFEEFFTFGECDVGHGMCGGG